jgi:hypothetical protein
LGGSCGVTQRGDLLLISRAIRERSRLRLVAGRPWVRRKVGIQHAGKQPDRAAADAEVKVGVAETTITGLVQSNQVALSEPSQASHGSVIVVLLHGEGHGPLDQPVHEGAGGGG